MIRVTHVVSRFKTDSGAHTFFACTHVYVCVTIYCSLDCSKQAGVDVLICSSLNTISATNRVNSTKESEYLSNSNQRVLIFSTHYVYNVCGGTCMLFCLSPVSPSFSFVLDLFSRQCRYVFRVISLTTVSYCFYVCKRFATSYAWVSLGVFFLNFLFLPQLLS